MADIKLKTLKFPNSENTYIIDNDYIATDINNDGNIMLEPYSVTDSVDFEAHIANKLNPHETTAAQIKALPAIEDPQYPGCYYRMLGGIKEWIEPPMVADQEYRTTERYNGKPVYKKLVSCGNLPNASLKTVDHHISNLEYVLSLNACTPYSNRGSFFPASTGALNTTFNIGIGGTAIWLVTESDRSTFTDCLALVRYTKSID